MYISSHIYPHHSQRLCVSPAPIYQLLCAKHMQAVLINDTVYIGGGDTPYEDIGSPVLKYDLSQDIWSPLPLCPVYSFGVGRLVVKLVTVGGIVEEEVTRDIHIFDEVSHTWKNSLILPMLTARCMPVVIGYHSSLIVAGGNIGYETVEVFFQQVARPVVRGRPASRTPL